MENDYEGPRFWVHDVPPLVGFKEAAREGWVGVVDEQEGGIILYCHSDNADKIVAALAAV